MMSCSIRSRLLIVVALTIGGAAGAAETPAGSRPADAKAASAENSGTRDKKGANSAAEIKKLMEEMRRTRDVMIQDYEALAKQLKDATEEQKKQIKEKMEAQRKAFEQVTNALHKQIRDEQRKLRTQPVDPKR